MTGSENINELAEAVAKGKLSFEEALKKRIKYLKKP